jgi:hypothetical protein
MGNVLAQPQRLQPELVADLPNVVFKDLISERTALGAIVLIHAGQRSLEMAMCRRC